ncbi:phosphatidate phosphatase LPIN [Apostasia shenzhenica]|uniref:Phosphatidate phosphatase LPIN n=1 Tax=Apostasia shenzhenica TaxID=1088818 RepID=A0A2I0B7N4_9ASPA|nr:phosphatidate phosphatase LPIN [Apostasia shenzhenica]
MKMNAVGKLGSFISRGVYTVSGPFHPFGGAVDIIVVQQPDGSFKSSPWYVRFGKFQGVLKTKEKIISICVNGEEAAFHMYLDHNGAAYFLKESETEEGDGAISPPSSGDETDDRSRDAPLGKIHSYKYDSSIRTLVAPVVAENGRILSRSNSQRSRFLGIMFGRKSIKECNQNGNIDRASSLERAEIAADLLDLKWSTNLLADNTSLKKPAGMKQEIQQPPCKYGEYDLDEKMDSTGESVSGNFETSYENKECFKEKALHDTTNLQAIQQPPCKDGAHNLDERMGSSGESASGNFDISILNMECSKESALYDTVNLQDEEAIIENSSQSGCSTSANGRTDQVPKELVRISNTGSLGGRSSSGDHELIGIFGENLVSEVCSDVLSSEVVEAKASLPRHFEENQFPFSDIGGIGYITTEEFTEKNMLCNVEGDIEVHASTDASDEESSEGLLEESITHTSLMEIPRNKAYLDSSYVLAKSLPAIRSHIHDLERSCQPCSLSRSLNLTSEKNNDLSKMDSMDISNMAVENPLSRHLSYEGEGLDEASEKLYSRKEFVFEPSGVVTRESVEQNGMADASANTLSSQESWKLWPFGFKRSKTINVVHSDHEFLYQPNQVAPMTMTSLGRDNDMNKHSKIKKKERLLTPSSEELASLNLKEGKNAITFSFATAMLGRQQVDARIYLWKWNTRIAISDVDGTITRQVLHSFLRYSCEINHEILTVTDFFLKSFLIASHVSHSTIVVGLRSDVLGQFMPLVGIDWSQTGVTHLFSAIKENGYQLLFLSARAISQAHLTRQFLFNLKQDGKVLPDGPVVISPDGLFPSLYREVIRRAPHEFKISCLEAIRALFPLDCNPFYAGFGNRDTDEISYLKVGIPRGKIFIINPKGEVAVNRRVDTKSYGSLHFLVNGMFPPMSSGEQEDFNSWNYWKLPLPEIIA